MNHEEKIAALANLHTLDIAAREMLNALDTKLEGVETETITVNVHALRLIRTIMSLQRETLSKFVETTLEVDDQLEAIMTQYGIRTD